MDGQTDIDSKTVHMHSHSHGKNRLKLAGDTVKTNIDCNVLIARAATIKYFTTQVLDRVTYRVLGYSSLIVTSLMLH